MINLKATMKPLSLLNFTTLMSEKALKSLENGLSPFPLDPPRPPPVAWASYIVGTTT